MKNIIFISLVFSMKLLSQTECDCIPISTDNYVNDKDALIDSCLYQIDNPTSLGLECDNLFTIDYRYIKHKEHFYITFRDIYINDFFENKSEIDDSFYTLDSVIPDTEVYNFLKDLQNQFGKFKFQFYGSLSVEMQIFLYFENYNYVKEIMDFAESNSITKIFFYSGGPLKSTSVDKVKTLYKISNNKLYINTQFSNLDLFDSSGRQMRLNYLNKSIIDVSYLKKGIYFLRIDKQTSKILLE